MKKKGVFFALTVIFLGLFTVSLNSCREGSSRESVGDETLNEENGDVGEEGEEQIPCYEFASAVPLLENSFATYYGYAVSITPAVAEYDLDHEAAVNNLGGFFDWIEGPLRTNGFFVDINSPCGKNFYTAYGRIRTSAMPIFITTDSLLHTFHILYDYSLRIVELKYFLPSLEDLGRALLERLDNYHLDISDPLLQEGARRAVAFFGVAVKLLDSSAEVPDYVSNVIGQEVSLIEGHAGFHSSPIFGCREDYSQYVPRGHYTRNDDFKRYFKAMMWLGRMSFLLNPPEMHREDTLGAILITRALAKTAIGDREGLVIWDLIYEPTVFYVGKSDDLGPREYIEMLTQVYGDDWQDIELAEYADAGKLNTFFQTADEYRDPRINSSFVYDGEDFTEVTKGFRFMGQRFIPDSYILGQLVHPGVEERLMPKGLDVMAVLGSERAHEVLDEYYGETSYVDYPEQVSKLKTEFSAVTIDDWGQNLYWAWLYSLLPLLEAKDAGFPVFMQNIEWQDKNLNTSLGSWAELRHDTILYAKQSYTGVTGMPTSFSSIGYVEPEPEVYGRLASLARMMYEGLYSRGILHEEIGVNLSSLVEILLSLKTISEKELLEIPITEEELDLILGAGGWLASVISFSEELASEITSEADDSMAVIADVHTDPNKSEVLEEAVGYALPIYVLVKIDGDLYIAAGAVFSYYEFKQPMSDRLTDEAWQEMLESGEAPDMPGWIFAE